MSLLNWSQANVDAEGRLRVPFEGPVDPDLLKAYADVIGTYESETRGQTWREVAVYTAGVEVAGVTDDTDSDQLRAYLDQAFKPAQYRADRDREAREAERAAADVKAAHQAAAAPRLTERFRRP